MPNVGLRVKDLRKLRGLSAEQLAEAAGISPATMYRYEKGDVAKIPSVNLLKFAERLGTTMDYLLGNTDNSELDDPNSELEYELVNETNLERTCEAVARCAGFIVQHDDDGNVVALMKDGERIPMTHEKILQLAQQIVKYFRFILQD